ncbi:MAG: chemotaxis response regulator protein-glutamate methylesterase [bacterium]
MRGARAAGDPIRVLIVEDSAVMRRLLTHILSQAPGIEVAGAAESARAARKLILRHQPDVMTLDVQMPGESGLSFLAGLMSTHPMPVVMVSAYTQAGAETTMAALKLGAVDFVAKPSEELGRGIEDLQEELIGKVRAAALSRVVRRTKSSPPLPPAAFPRTEECVVAIGSSMGGAEALSEILPRLPVQSPGILIVQHMPEKFTRTFANRLDDISAIRVKEAQSGDRILPGQALLAPGNRHMALRRSSLGYSVEVHDGPKVWSCRPSVDVLFASMAQIAGKSGVGVILTGMGKDGVDGIARMKCEGARTIAQDEETSVVFGMPKEAIGTGAVDYVLPLEEIPARLAEILREGERPSPAKR